VFDILFCWTRSSWFDTIWSTTCRSPTLQADHATSLFQLQLSLLLKAKNLVSTINVIIITQQIPSNYYFCLSNAMHSIGQSIKSPECPSVQHFLSYLPSTFPLPSSFPSPSPPSFLPLPLSLELFSSPFSFPFPFPFPFPSRFPFPFPSFSPSSFPSPIPPFSFSPFLYSFPSPFSFPFPLHFPYPSFYLPLLSPSPFPFHFPFTFPFPSLPQPFLFFFSFFRLSFRVHVRASNICGAIFL